MYTTFFGVLSLVFYVIENPRNAASQEILRDAREGKDTLACLAPRSMAADRSSQYLAVSTIVLRIMCQPLSFYQGTLRTASRSTQIWKTGIHITEKAVGTFEELQSIRSED